MAEGHPALLHANYKFSRRAVFNNSEAHMHNASQGGLFRTEGATQGIPGVAGSPVAKAKFTRKTSGVPGQNLDGTERKRRTTAVTAEAPEGAAEAPQEKRKRKRVPSSTPGLNKDLTERKPWCGRKLGSENVKTKAARERLAEHAEHADASSNEADGEEHDDGPDGPPSFDELPSAGTLGRAKPLTRTHVAPGPLDLSLSVDQIMTNVLHVATPAVRRRKKAHSRSAPSLPTLGVFCQLALEDASPHVHCSSCGLPLGSETSGNTYRLVDVVPLVSLCAPCFMEPTVQLARLLLNSTTVQRICIPNVEQPAPTSDGAPLPAVPVEVASLFQIVVPSPVYIAELCPTCGGGCPQELLRPESASVLCTPIKILRTTPALAWSPGILVTWCCEKTGCDTGGHIRPTLLTIARDGLSPISVKSGPDGQLNLADVSSIYMPTRNLAFEASSRFKTRTALRAGMERSVQCALDMGADVEPLSGVLLTQLLKAVVMHTRARFEVYDAQTRDLGISACHLCARVPGCEKGGTILYAVDCSYCWNQQGKQSKNSSQEAKTVSRLAAEDSATLQEGLRLVLSNDELGVSYSKACKGDTPQPVAADATPQPTGAPARDQAHGTEAEPGATDDACVSAACAAAAKYLADKATAPISFDAQAEESKKALILGTFQCNHSVVAKAAVSSRPENYAFITAIIEAALNDPAFSPGMISHPHWPEELRDVLFLYGCYDIACRFKLYFEKRWMLRFTAEETAALRNRWLLHVNLPLVAAAVPNGAEPIVPEPAAALPCMILHCIGAFHAKGHVGECERTNGQYAMAGTGLAQGDQPEVLNAYLEKIAHLTRNLSRANTAAHLEVSLLQFNEHLQLTVVQRLVKLRNAARARLENVVRSRQTLVANDRQAPTNAEIDSMRREIRQAVSPAAVGITGAAITPSSGAAVVLAAKARAAGLNALQAFIGIYPTDGIFDPGALDYQSVLEIYSGMVVNKFNEWNTLGRTRTTLAIKAASVLTAKADAAHSKACLLFAKAAYGDPVTVPPKVP